MYFHFVFLITCLCWAPSTHADSGTFCYDDSDPNCPAPGSWGGQCNDGSTSQSPIQLPGSYSPSFIPRSVDLRMSKYRGDTFRFKNTGSSVAIKFPGSTDPVTLRRKEGSSSADFKLHSAHFHWGRNDSVGSEHCLQNGCFSMELHLVHYKSNFDSLDSAIKSSDTGALTVLGIMLQVTDKAGQGNKYLAPIVQNIAKVTNPSHDWIDVNSVLDFTSYLTTAAEGKRFNYRGSLTTPDCNEKVNWYVFDNPVAISSQDVEAFRSINDARGKPLKENNRPMQSVNNRRVYHASVRQV